MKQLYILFLFLFVSSSILNAQDSISNSDFENWTGGYPENWETNSCPPCVPPWETYIAQKDSINTFHGAYSLKLMYNNTSVSTGFAPAWVKSRFPVQSHPVELEGYVRSEIFGSDTVSIEIKVFFNEVMVDSGYWENTVSINQWQKVNIPISTTGNNADSVQIIIMGGKGVFDTITSNDTKFWVDYISLNYTTGINDKKKSNSLINVFPIPTDQYVIIENTGYQKVLSVILYDMFGNVIKKIESSDIQLKIDISEFPTGIYLLKCKTTKEEKFTKIIKTQ
jgi:hypothetical protein